MSFPKAILFGERADITDVIPTGQVAFWANGGQLKIRVGSVTSILDIGLTLEQLQDLLATSFADTASITWNYNDDGNVFEASIAASVLNTINSALQAGANISVLNNDLGFETPAQLSNRDSANRQRANHTGTQLASTISDFNAAVATYLDRKTPQQIVYNTANYSINTTTTPLVIVDEDFTPLHTAKYRVVANFGHSYDEATTNNRIELLINDTIIKKIDKEPKDVGGTDGASGTDQNERGHFEYLFDVVASTPFNIKFQHYSQTGGVESTIKDLDLYVERYL